MLDFRTILLVLTQSEWKITTKAIEVVVFKTKAHVFMWMARKQVKTHARPLSVRYLVSINCKSIFKQHSSKTNPNIFRKILIYWNTEAFLMSGGGLIHLVLMLPLIFKSFVHYSFGSKNN